jgi:hypothetical protein
METPEVFSVNRNVKEKIKRSNVMKNSTIGRFLKKGILAIFTLALVATVAMGQNLNAAGTFTGTGIYIVNGNVVTSGATAVTIPGTVKLNGTSTQTVGGGTGLVTIDTLKATGISTKSLAVNTTVTKVDVAATGATKFQLANNVKLTVEGTITNSGLADAPYDFTTGPVTEVDYHALSGTAQAIYGTTYDKLTMSGSQGFTLAADATANGAISQTGAALTVNNNLTAVAGYTFGAVTVNSSKTLLLSSTGGSISQVTDVISGSKIENGSGALLIATLSDNNGTIENSTNNGTIDITNPASNHGTITGGSGKITFHNTLAEVNGTITAGSGDIDFLGIVTQTGGSIASSALANVLNFNANVNNTAGTINLTSTGAAAFAGTVNATGLSFATGTTVTYNGSSAGQAIADVDYGNLTLMNSTKSWPLGGARTINNLDVQASSATTVSGSYGLNINGNVTVNDTLIKSADTVKFASAASAVSGSNNIKGSVKRTHTFATGIAYTFNNVATTVTPATVGTLSSFTISSLPSTAPTGYLAGNSVDRKFAESYTGSGFTADVQLGYAAAEYTGGASSKLKFFQGGIAKANKIGGSYSIGTSGSFSYVKLATLASTSLTSGLELGIDDRYNMFISQAIADWNVGTTWDMLSVPGASDDVEIAPTFAVTISTVGAAANSVTIDEGVGATGGLTLSGVGTLLVGAGGLTNSNTLGVGLNVSTGSNIATITGGNLTNNGKITNAGTITVQ